ncbi:MAG TPA: monovalent cation/H+ antiporter subunit A [Candidatus Competibacteraceae bacterium]|nr:monovalent cation/H+ antiporter subunit A [Candidatus Competibacteraceae bacterium]
MSLLLVILTPFLGAALVAWVSHRGRLHAAWIAGLVTLIALAWLLPLASAPFAGQTLIQRFSWMPTAGLDLAFRLDGLSLLFALLILLIGLLIILYARYYLSPNDSMGRFYASLLLFMGSMLGVALSENIIQLLIFWELTSLSSFLLISYWQQRTEARNGARMALTVTGAGGLALLGGFLLLGKIAGSYDLSVILASGDVIHADPLYLPMLILVLLGAFTKSAQFPFHFWLPSAMAAPTPVSAYLHSATLVKAGVFLLARLFPALSGTPEWSMLVGGVGLTTLLIGAFIALFQHDLKGLLAYSTISHLGLITLLFGIGTPLAAVAGVFHIINHATFKASLFMAAGIIDHETGSRDMRRINGLWKFMPHTAALSMVASAAMAGVPLLNGFLSKEMFFAEAVGVTTQMRFGWLLPAAVTVAGVFAVAYSLRFIHDVFFNGEPINLPKTPHEPPRWMKVPVEILVALCLLVGIFPAITVEPILAVASIGVLQGPLPEHDLAIWHGFSPALWMSVIALIGGGLTYLGRRPLFTFYERHEHRLEAKALYQRLLNGLFTLTQAVTQRLDTGSLQRMLFVFILSALMLGLAGFLSASMPLTGSRPRTSVDGVSLLATLSLLAAAISAVWLHRQRLIALILTGAVGLVVALIFIKFSAPDLVLTQLSVEVVTIVLLLLALYFLPQHSPVETDLAQQRWQILLAVAAGSSAAALTWAVVTRPYETIAGYFLANSVPGGGGGNVVNVILVDFRGYDTLGEISVLALAGMGIYAMLASLRLDGPEQDAQGRAWDPDLHPVILSSLTRLLLPLALLVAIFIFLRGHNLPGGGFIAGLITAVALIMQYLSNGAAWMRSRLPWNMHIVIGLGLLIATLTGLSSLIFGYPFLTSTFDHLHWPAVGEFELASAMAFELGVYLVVVGATLLILIRLGLMHQANRITPN